MVIFHYFMFLSYFGKLLARIFSTKIFDFGFGLDLPVMMVVSGSTNSNTSWGEKARGEKEQVEGWCWGSAPANNITIACLEMFRKST